ncbi:MAG: fluoroacetyl-CoA thioesterase [Verrucomicrobiales bacterium]
MTIELGLSGTASMTVASEDTAIVHGTGDVEVLSTPRLLQLMQQATMDALDGHMPHGMITAGLRVNLDHLHASFVGADVIATATLTRIEGRRLVFEVEAVTSETTVGIGRIIRVQIDKERFLSRL